MLGIGGKVLVATIELSKSQYNCNESLDRVRTEL